MDATALIRKFNMSPLPIEGGYFSINYQSNETVAATALPERYHNDRVFGNAIYFLETPDQFSAIHRLPTDEIYFYHLGDALEFIFLHPDGSGEKKVLGPDIAAGQVLQIVAPRHSFHGSRPMPNGENGFSFVGASMSPGFDDSDPYFPSRDELLEKYSEFRAEILATTRLKRINID